MMWKGVKLSLKVNILKVWNTIFDACTYICVSKKLGFTMTYI